MQLDIVTLSVNTVKVSPYTRPRRPFFNLGASWGWVVNSASSPLYLRERLGAHCIGDWVVPNTSLNGCGKSRPRRDLIPETSSPKRVAILTAIFRPTNTVKRGAKRKTKGRKNPNHTSLHENYVVPCICLRAIWHAWFVLFQRCASHRTMHRSYRSKTYTWNDVILVKRSMIRVLSCLIQVGMSRGTYAAN